MKYWIGVASRDHVFKGVAGGFIQVCHGKEAPLKKLSKGDRIIYYSPKVEFLSNIKLQAFTAIGTINSEEIYSFKMFEDFIPFRRNVSFLPCKEVFLKDLNLQIKNTYYLFRRGLFEICEEDFNTIQQAMIVE